MHGRVAKLISRVEIMTICSSRNEIYLCYTTRESTSSTSVCI